jgi:hypothetical protein
MGRALLAGAVALILAVSAAAAPHPAGTAAAAGAILHLPTGNTTVPPDLAGGEFGGIAVDKAGNIYAGVTVGAAHSYVAVYDKDRHFVTDWPSDNRTQARDKLYLAVGPEGLIYTAPQGNDVISVFHPDGSLVRQFGAGSGINDVRDIEVDGAGNVFVTSRGSSGHPDDQIVRFDPQGAVTGRFTPLPGRPGATASALRGLALVPDGSMWVTTDDQTDPVVHLDANGNRLSSPNFGDKLIIPEAHAGQFEDVEYGNGNLYFTGAFGPGHGSVPGGPNIESGLAVVTPTGELLDLLSGHGFTLAVAEKDVYVTGLDASITTAAGRSSASADEFGGEHSVPMDFIGKTNAFGWCPDVGQKYDSGYQNVPTLVFLGGGNGCTATFTNKEFPTCAPASRPVPGHAWVGGRRLPDHDIEAVLINGSLVTVNLDLGDSTFGNGGDVVIEYDCHQIRSDGTVGPDTGEVHYEYKGRLDIVDPSGKVVDARTGKAVPAASVSLQVSPVQGGTFGTPSLSAVSPQLLTAKTDSKGAFGWDVAPGYWRLVVTAYGYKRYVSKAYKVPPAVTNLVLRLTPDPRQQRYLIDPSGHIGPVRLGARPKRVAGLRLQIVRRRVKRITVRSKRFRTATGIKLGSLRGDLVAGFPQLSRKSNYLSAATYRVARTTFSVSKKTNRVTKIVLR